MVKVRKSLIKQKNRGRVFSYIPEDILREVKFNEKKQYYVDYWNMGNTICMKLVERKKR